MDLLQNLHIVADTKRLPAMIGDRPVHATNGTYIYGAMDIVPRNVAGYQAIIDDKKLAAKRDVMLIAVNSDISMEKIMKKKGASQEEIHALESQIVRAMKMAEPLALQHQDREVYVAFYDEETPNALYGFLAEKDVSLRTLHKHGYGTEPNAPKVEGSEHFAITIGFPLPNDKKPVCYDLTPRETQDFIIVNKLTELVGSHGKPYLSEEGLILFPVHDEVYKYTQAHTDAERAMAANSKPAPAPWVSQP